MQIRTQKVPGHFLTHIIADAIQQGERKIDVRVPASNTAPGVALGQVIKAFLHANREGRVILVVPKKDTWQTLLRPDIDPVLAEFGNVLEGGAADTENGFPFFRVQSAATADADTAFRGYFASPLLVIVYEPDAIRPAALAALRNTLTGEGQHLLLYSEGAAVADANMYKSAKDEMVEAMGEAYERIAAAVKDGKWASVDYDRLRASRTRTFREDAVERGALEALSKIPSPLAYARSGRAKTLDFEKGAGDPVTVPAPAFCAMEGTFKSVVLAGPGLFVRFEDAPPSKVADEICRHLMEAPRGTDPSAFTVTYRR